MQASREIQRVCDWLFLDAPIWFNYFLFLDLNASMFLNEDACPTRLTRFLKADRTLQPPNTYLMVALLYFNVCYMILCAA